MFAMLIALLVVGLVAYNAVVFAQAPGTVAQRLAAAWQGSLTRFTLAWGGVVYVWTGGLDFLSGFVGAPEFSQALPIVKAHLDPKFHDAIAFAVMLLAYWARGRTAPK